MNKTEKIFNVITCFVVFLIGFFVGEIYNKENNEIILSENQLVVSSFKEMKSDNNFWYDGYMKRDTVLLEISSHDDCTFELRKIIGKIY